MINLQQRAWIEIDHHALVCNFQEITKILASNCRFMAVIKADAYGHGAVNVAETLIKNGCSFLAIATLKEGIELRENGIKARILLLGAINTLEEIEEAINYNLEPTLVNIEQAIIFADTCQNLQKTLSIHLKIDTGMTRLGTLWHEALDFIEFVHKLPSLTIKSIYSHLATADDLDVSFMQLQQERFNQLIIALKKQNLSIPLLHLANSAGTLQNQTLHYDLVRVGLALYGAYPAPHFKQKVNLTPVMQVKARITQIKTIPAHTGVSYNHTFVGDRQMKIAVVGIGYADGIPRLLSNRMQVLIKGIFCPQIGNITMDQIMIDITDLPPIKVGEIVTILGKDGVSEIVADDWANTIGTISWEIFCGFKNRLPRIKIGVLGY